MVLYLLFWTFGGHINSSGVLEGSKLKGILSLVLILVIATFFTVPGSGKMHTALEDYIIREESCIREFRESEDLFVFVDLNKRILFLFKNGEQIKKYRIATGTGESPSPIGVFRVVEKGKWGKGFGGRWMGLNVSWGIYGIHGTTTPESIGRAASHGCIRMRSRDAAELYEYVRYGTVVEMYGGPFGPFGKGFRELHPGDSGADVMEVQRNLRLKGYYKGSLSGYYCTATERALNSFQRAGNLPVSNVIDNRMYERLGIILSE